MPLGVGIRKAHAKIDQNSSQKSSLTACVGSERRRCGTGSPTRCRTSASTSHSWYSFARAKKFGGQGDAFGCLVKRAKQTECCSKAARCRFLSLTPPLPPFLAVPAMAADCSLVDAVYDLGLPAPAPLLRRCAVLLCIVVVVVCEVVSRCGSTRVCLLDDVAILPNNPPFCAGFPVVSLALGMWKGPMILVSIIDRQRRRTLQAQARRALLCGGGGGMGGGSAGTGQDSS